MQTTKKISFIICSILLIGWITLAADNIIKWDPNNLIQHIWKIIFTEKDNSIQNNKPTITTYKNGVSLIKTDNFILTSSWNSNEIKSWYNNSILWGQNNNISSERWKNAIWNTIIWWSGNRIHNSKGSTIWWWKENYIDNSTWSTIIWWQNNNIKWRYSSIIWWQWNTIKGSNSIIAWEWNTITWDNSVIIWRNWNINKKNSFLRSDGENANVTYSDVFAVLWQNWMIINSDTAKELAQLTIWWSIIIKESANDQNITCNNNSEWTIKLIKKSESQKCFCHCKWWEWNSVLWEWQCESICRNGNNASIEARCGNVSNTCENNSRFVIGSTYVDQKSVIHRSCQWIDWSAILCSK